jgi:hypothetical protein
MNNSRHRRFRSQAPVAFLITSLLISSCQPIYVASFGPSRISSLGGTQAGAAVTAEDLAAELDDLERQIERTGSVVAEQPSVWGQARLTMYREEFETQMQQQLSKFQATLQGSLSRTDQAYAADAMALSYTAQAAASGSSDGSPKAASSSSSSSGGGSSSAATPSTTSASSADPIPGTFDAFASGNFTRNAARLANPLGFGVTGQNGISLEPTIYLDQMKRYIDHLHELRRMSDGDDTADAPGYSLNLVRIPVSVLPGRRTQQRYGAEITFNLKPHLNDELLPMTFRNLVLNDLIDQIGVPLAHVLNDLTWTNSLPKLANLPAVKKDRKKFAEFVAVAIDPSYPCDSAVGQTSNDVFGRNTLFLTSLAVRSATKVKNARQSFPPSQIIDIYGARGWAEILCTAYQTFKQDVPNRGEVHYPDVQNYLQEELNAAYEFLKAPQNELLWRGYCDKELVDQIHGRRLTDIKKRRCDFESVALKLAAGVTSKPEVTAALAWAIIVDSALLNNQLMEDMVQAPAARGGSFALPETQPGDWRPYYLPVPNKPERETFNEYVRCRWPIHVFSLDPEADQQNIADSYSSRREMQLAMSLAFVSGNLSADNMFRYARRLETDMETIALNNTMVGFSHGAETFGWRFYPRFQSPDTDNNLTVFFRDLLWGGPNRKTLLRQRQLEPGIRECVAIVLMPSFVPYADLEASSNWFALDNPHRKVMNSVRAVRLGEQLKSIKNCAQMVSNPQCYRDGDVERLQRRADQLESRLPLQSMSVQVPYENTLGGFAMFNTGVTDLAPELLGWYGAPAVNLDAPTTIFLIGNHFSVHQTRVLIGGQEITTPEMLSRQVMKVTIPANAIALVEKTGEVSGGWNRPNTRTEITPPQSAGSVTSTSGATTTVNAPSSVFLDLNKDKWYMFAQESDDAITLADAAIPGSLDSLKLSVDHGTLTLGKTEGISFASGANGSASLNVTGTVDKLNAALNGMVYVPNPDFSGGADTLKVALAGPGVTATCEVSVSIILKQKWPDFLYVDVQLATPYGATSHLLVPAWHLGKSGSGSLMPAASGGAASSSDSSGAGSSAVSQPQWLSTQLALGYVAKGIGIAASDPPSCTPSALTISLGTNYLVPSDNTVTLTFKLGGNASGAAQPLKIAVIPSTPGSASPANYDPKAHVLTIAGQDLVNLTNYLVNVIQYQFGAARPIVPPNTSFTLDTAVSGTGQASFNLVNQLTVNLVPAAAK